MEANRSFQDGLQEAHPCGFLHLGIMPFIAKVALSSSGGATSVAVQI